MVEYFDSVGVTIAEGFNPADFICKLLAVEVCLKCVFWYIDFQMVIEIVLYSGGNEEQRRYEREGTGGRQRSQVGVKGQVSEWNGIYHFISEIK